ncbi:MAG TPA: hypothetical protein VIG66_10705 [Noviherbaspirillum sp.]
MWNIVVVAVMAALTGFYMLPAEQSMSRNHELEARQMAISMGVYRQAVRAYYTANNGTLNYSVTVAELNAGNFLPEWSHLRALGENGPWANYRNAAGTVYVYPKELPTRNMLAELLDVAHRSVNVAVYRAADSSLYSPGDNQRFPHPQTGGGIPDGAPVWIATP